MMRIHLTPLGRVAFHRLAINDLSNLGMPQVNAPVAYFCEGAGINAGVVAGRLTTGAMFGGIAVSLTGTE